MMAEFKHLALGRRLAGQRVDPPENGFHAGDQLQNAERLGDVVVRAELQAEHPVQLRGFRGQYQDRHEALVAAERTADAQPVGTRQAKVENHQVPLPCKRLPHAFMTVGCDGHIEAVVLQMQFEQAGNIRFVLYHQDAALRVRLG
jgi:hypothetical protein